MAAVALHEGNKPVLGRLREEDLRPLAAVAERHCYRKGQMIVAQPCEEDGIFVVVTGSVRLYLLGPAGQELTLVRRRSGDVFELGGVDPDLPDETIVEALADRTVLFFISWPRFLRTAATSPSAASCLAMLLRQRRAEERALVRELAFFTMKARLAHKLAELAKEHPQQQVNETREALAAMIGTRPEAVTKALQQLRAEGLVHFRPHSHRAIVVLHPDALASYGKEAL